MKIVILDGYTLNPGDLSWSGLEELGDVTIYDRTPNDEIVSRIGDAEIVFVNKTPITGETIAACSNIIFIGVFATGYNVVDIHAARERSIPVCNVPTYGTAAVSQFVFSLILEICNHVGEHNTSVKNGEWTNSKDFCYWNYPLVELAGKTLGIVGYGRIGEATAKIAQAFGMKVLAHDPHPKTSAENISVEFVGLERIFANSDIISLHCPLFKETEGIINRENIDKCKDGVIIVNTSRGGLVNEQDVKEALLSGKVAYFATDVASAEPIRKDNPLLSAPNTIITPHIAWAPKEARKRLLDIAVKNLRSFLAGKPENVVN